MGECLIMITFREFMDGKGGWSHVAQEFAVWAVLVGLCGWLISPLAGWILAVNCYVVFRVYWFQREIMQSLAMGRVPSKEDLIAVPVKPTSFWTADAIADVDRPWEFRYLWFLLSLSYLTWLYFDMGFVGVLLK